LFRRRLWVIQQQSVPTTLEPLEPRPAMAGLIAQTLPNGTSGDREPEQPLDLRMDLDEPHGALGSGQNLEDCPAHRSELQLPVTRTITTFPLLTGHLPPLPFRETLVEGLGLKV
jgi:hypothetical protein